MRKAPTAADAINVLVFMYLYVLHTTNYTLFKRVRLHVFVRVRLDVLQWVRRDVLERIRRSFSVQSRLLRGLPVNRTDRLRRAEKISRDPAYDESNGNPYK